VTGRCQFCGAEVFNDWKRRRYVDLEGCAHRCPVPELPDLRECICGQLVTVLADGRRFDFKTGQTHEHEGAVAVRPQPQRSGKALWDVYRA
jgi:hypothetical protein